MTFTSLVSCDPTKSGSCKDCTGATLGHQCYTVDEKNPYKYQEGTATYDIPDGNWCLPTRVATTQCNEWTGVPILTKLGEGKYEWLCDCSKYPGWFTSALGGDCTVETVCGYDEGDPTKSIGELVCPKGGISGICTEGEPWLKTKNWDPKFGVCNCITGYDYVGHTPATGEMIKVCTKNTCYPGTEHTPPSGPGNTCGQGPGNSNCTCNTLNKKIETTSPRLSSCTGKMEKVKETQYQTWLRCPEDVKSELGQQCFDSPQCIPDPCNPLGHYDTKNCACICDASSTARAVPADNAVGSKCVDYCAKDDATNPCIQTSSAGNVIHGTTCYVEDNNYHCKDCCPPFTQDSTDLCSDVCLPDNEQCQQDGSIPCCPGSECKRITFGIFHEHEYLCKPKSKT